jgi:recombination DNA repair RAD52 pathway protein
MSETTAQDMHDEVINNRPDETAGIDDNSIPGEENITLDGVSQVAPRHSTGASVLTPEQITALGAPWIQRSRVKLLDGNSYLQAWDVKATLIKIFGWGGFSTEVLEAEIVKIREHGAGDTPGHTERFDSRDGKKKKGDAKTPQVIAKVTMRLTLHNIGPAGQDVVHTEVAVGINSQWDIGAACDTALKSAESDALKRCAIFLGTQFGLSLYNAGDINDVVKRVLVPWQGKVIADARAATAAANAAQVSQQLARATGGGS